MGGGAWFQRTDPDGTICYIVLVRDTQRKGDIAKAVAISTFTKAGYDVAVLLTESAAYDLVIDDGTGLYRVQVKYSINREIPLTHVHSNAKGYVVKKTAENAYDWLYVYRPGDGEFLIKKCFSNRTTYSLQETDRITEGSPHWYAAAS